MFGPYETSYDIIVDMMLIFIFSAGIFVGYRRSVYESLVALVVQILSLYLSYVLANQISLYVMTMIPPNIELSSYLPEEFQLLLKPYEPNVLPTLMKFIFLIVIFIVLKSFLWHFGHHYLSKIKQKAHHAVSLFILSVISSIVTVVTTCTYLIPILIILAFPGFELISTHAIANQVIERLPIFSTHIQPLYAKADLLKNVMKTYNQATCDDLLDEAICLDEIILRVSLNEAKWEDYIPSLATQEGYMQLFDKDIITEVMMLEHVNKLKFNIESNVVTKDLINLYYKELIDNETYDILIKNQIVTKPSLYVLLHSGLLNIENYNSLEEYL